MSNGFSILKPFCTRLVKLELFGITFSTCNVFLKIGFFNCFFFLIIIIIEMFCNGRKIYSFSVKNTHICHDRLHAWIDLIVNRFPHASALVVFKFIKIAKFGPVWKQYTYVQYNFISVGLLPKFMCPGCVSVSHTFSMTTFVCHVSRVTWA